MIHSTFEFEDFCDFNGKPQRVGFSLTFKSPVLPVGLILDVEVPSSVNFYDGDHVTMIPAPEAGKIHQYVITSYRASVFKLNRADNHGIPTRGVRIVYQLTFVEGR